MTEFMVYGCTGYTGRLVTEYAKSQGLPFILAGRNAERVRALGMKFDLRYRVFDISDPSTIDASLQGVRILLNCAGPFKHTARPLIEGCIRNGTHYLDVAAELDSYFLADELDQKAKEAKVMLMPGCGGSVPMLGCLAGYAVEGVQSPVAIDIALHIAGSMSRGSAVSAAGGLTTELLQCIDGALAKQEASATRNFDFKDGKGCVGCFPVTLPDLITIWKSTKVPNIRTFVHVSGDALPTESLANLPDGPTMQQRDASPYHAAVKVTSQDGTVKHAVLHTVNGYTFTSQASVEAVRQVLRGDAASGFQTPAAVLGVRFVESIAGSVME